jgi:D-arabinose 1-dehydrogenase-like Zn-dependent alcohol dehydrogenase
MSNTPGIHRCCGNDKRLYAASDIRGLLRFKASSTQTGLEQVMRAAVVTAFELHAAGRTQVVRTTRRIDEVNEAMKAVEAGDIDARVVFDFRSETV